jgi:glc operon protein GlcG
MSSRYAGLEGILLTVLCAMCAFAQAPTATSAPVAYGLPIGLEDARKAADAAMTEARKNNWTMAIAVVDPGGILVFYEKMENTQIGSADVAIEKALTAVRFKRPSKAFQDLVGSGGGGLRILRLPGAVPLEGGIPLLMNGKIVGAIGVSGDSSDHDGLCAQAGAATVK